MSWVRRAEEQTPAHSCDPPMWVVAHTFPSVSLNPKAVAKPWTETVPAGRLDDLWRCDDCRELWRVGRRCDACDAYGPGSHGGQCAVGLAWRPATLWQRIRYRRTR